MGFWITFLIFLLAIIVTGQVMTMSDLGSLYSSFSSPVDWVIYQPPRVQYSDQLVNVWIPKPWRQDGKRIPCLFYLNQHLDEYQIRSNKLVIYSHGNAENILTTYPLMQQLSQLLECDMLTYEYSGYGLNEFDSYERTAEGMNATLDAVVRHACKELGYERSQIYLLGYSLGSGVSTAIASRYSATTTVKGSGNSIAGRQNLGGLILVSAFASLRQVVSDQISSHVAPYITERWNNVEAIRNVTCPVLIVHGELDSLFPLEQHAKALKRHAHQQSRAQWLVLDDVGHNGIPWKEVSENIQLWWQQHSI